MSIQEEIKINNQLKSIIAREKLTQKELARRMGVTEQQVTNWVRGIYMPKLILALRIAKELNATVEDIWSIKEESS